MRDSRGRNKTTSERIPQRRDTDTQEKGMAFADHRAEPGGEHYHSKGRCGCDGAEVANIFSGKISVASEYVVNDHVDLEGGDELEAVEHQEGRATKFEKGSATQRLKEASEEAVYFFRNSSDACAPACGILRRIFESFPQEDRWQHANGNASQAHQDRKGCGAIANIPETVELHEPQEPRRKEVGELTEKFCTPMSRVRSW